jgi:hypothetical protein
MKVTAHLHLGPSSDVVELYLHSPTHIFMARFLIKHGDNFTFSNWVPFQGGRHHLGDLNVLLRLILKRILKNQPEGKIKVAYSDLCLLHGQNCNRWTVPLFSSGAAVAFRMLSR